ncbi:unnamed protein product [Allacma fusca]|uniref:Uncharacterized protein n=1 Tax=Allacma fusca TaxID=39272 RepID=A0A8J2KEM5_9HEXA|nr:unnamed protein product [Allacma fusca]
MNFFAIIVTFCLCVFQISAEEFKVLYAKFTNSADLEPIDRTRDFLSKSLLTSTFIECLTGRLAIKDHIPATKSEVGEFN